MTPRAAIVVTGSELVRGERTDLNGPFLTRELHALGIEPLSVTIVGDGEADIERALTAGFEAELCVVSGGLGPTHDDRTVEMLARTAGRPMVVDAALRDEISAVSRSISARIGRPYSEFAEGVTKQATLPEGAVSLGLAGTAPGVLLEANGTLAIALPGPPRELRALWASALLSDPLRRLLARADPPVRQVLRFYGVSESAVALALAEAGGEPPGVDVTICAREFELNVDLVARPDAAEALPELAARLRGPLEPYFFADSDTPIEAVVLDLCRQRGLTVATAESCTGGLVAARLTSIPGSSDVVRGGIVAYANDVKEERLGVPADTLARFGAVSAETAAAMAHGARRALGADIGVSVTGVAGPGGGTAEKPVGLVYMHAEGPDGGVAAEFNIAVDRNTIRGRATVTALHLVRRLLTQSRHKDA